jgi:hypothetical protein
MCFIGNPGWIIAEEVEPFDRKKFGDEHPEGPLCFDLVITQAVLDVSQGIPTPYLEWCVGRGTNQTVSL